MCKKWRFLARSGGGLALPGQGVEFRVSGFAIAFRVVPVVILSAEPSPMTDHAILINRAPVLTLWATTVAERLGFDHDEALSLGKAVAGLTAQSKGRHLGIYKPVPQELKKARARKRGEEFFIEICGRAVPAINTPEGVRAVNKNQPVDAKSAERYLESKFGDSHAAVHAAMRDLAKSFPPAQLSQIAFSLYEKFRPAIPPGVTGWGAKGTLDIARIRSLASQR
jgi:hypothetical protein